MKNGIFNFASIFVILIITCSSHKRDSRNAIATISVENERIYIAPLINQTGIEKVDGWPQSEYEQKVLLKQFTILWELLKSELQRCEKYGYYTVVEDDQNPSVRISITLDKFQLTEDSLLIPVNMQVEHIPDAKFFIYTLPTSSKLPSNLSRNQSSIQKLGMILSEYRRKFPYQLIVSFFYTQPH
jgi:hypothetical protein